MILLPRNCESQSFILRKFGVTVKHKQEEPSSHTHMWTHGPESNWGRCCAAEKHCPPKLSSTLCYNYPNTCNVNTYCTCSGKQDCSSSIHTHKSISATHKIQPNQCILIFLHPAPNTPPPTPSYHPVRSRRWFFGRSCTAHCSQASATLCPSPPSLHTLSHTTVLSGSVLCLPLLINYSDICQDTYMHTHTDPHTLTDTEESADAQGWAAGAWAELSSGWVRRWHQIRILQYGAILPFSFEYTTDPLDNTAVSQVAL